MRDEVFEPRPQKSTQQAATTTVMKFSKCLPKMIFESYKDHHCLWKIIIMKVHDTSEKDTVCVINYLGILFKL